MNVLEIFFEDTDIIDLNDDLLKKYIGDLIDNESKLFGNISIILCSDQYLLDINQEYLKHDYYTDIVTFDYVDGSLISGDLFISIDRVLDNSKQFERPFKEELFRVIFHGVLHLVGYKDKREDDQKVMREKENFYLKNVDFKQEGI